MFSGPGVVWVAALLAMLLSLNSLFLADYEDGSLEQLLVSPQPLVVLGLGKTLAHWLTSGVPLMLLSPLLAVAYRLPAETIGVLVLTLGFGTISMSLLGSIGAALTVGLHRGTALLSLLILPLAMPVLIFGARTVSPRRRRRHICDWSLRIGRLCGRLFVTGAVRDGRRTSNQ